jgi:hypothetical protein
MNVEVVEEVEVEEVEVEEVEVEEVVEVEAVFGAVEVALVFVKKAKA